MATDTFTTDTQPHPSQPHLPMETHLLILATLFATWVLPPPSQPRDLLHFITVIHFTVLNTTFPWHPPSVPQTPNIPNHVLWHTPKIRYTKSRARFFAQGTLSAPNHVPTFHQSPVTLLHKGTSQYLIWR